ncbi:uncharacterized protein [Oryza sativa Japonica Group]|uniref:uncharacterized protein n=1 Tax=Oryza sativa subsp. japonica TaxID=39947 RepID=UPI00339C0EC7
MVPPIAGNGRAKSGRLPLPPAAIPVAVPAPPVAGSLPHPIKWDPHPSFYRFSPFPSLPVVVSPLPAFSFSLSDAGRPPATSPSSPEHRPAVPSPPSALQHRPLHRPYRLLAGNSPERCPRRQPVALVPLYSLQPAAVHRRCADRRRRLLLRHRGIAFFPGITSSSPEFRRNAVARAGLTFLLVDISSGCPGRRARASADVAVSSLGDAASPSTPACPRFRRNVAANLSVRLAGVVRPPVPPRRVPVGHLHHHLRHRSRDVVLGLASPSTEPRRCSSSSSRSLSPGSSSRGAASVVGIVAAWSSSSSSPCSRCRLSSSPPRRSRSSSSSSSSRRSRSSWRSSLRRAVLVRRPRSSSEPLQPRPRVRPRLRVVKPRAGRSSPSPKDRRRSRPLAVRLRCARLSPPRPFVVVVPTPRRVVACSFACVLRVAFVVPEVPEAWFVVVAEGSESRSL